MNLRWPRGRYNGRRIVGIWIKLRIDVLHCRVRCGWNFGEPYLVIGPLFINCGLNFEL